MYRKSSVFASGSQSIAPKTDTEYRQGMVPNTVAMAEDVNAYGLTSDQMNWTMSQELCNLLEQYGVTLGSGFDSNPSSTNNKMLIKLLKEKYASVRCLTGLTGPTIPVITQSGNQLTIPQLSVRFNSNVYYGTTEALTPIVTVSAQTLSASGSWATGVHYIYATDQGGIGHQTTPVLGADGATKCMLGSVYVYNGAFQANTWKYQPWLQVSAVEDRESPTAYTKGGYMSANTSSTFKMGALEIRAEGINVDSDVYTPNIMLVSAETPYTYKALYPGYNPGSSDVSDVGTTAAGDVGSHIYNTTSGSWDDAKTWASGFVEPKYMVIVPCITPAGQTLFIPAMSAKVGNNYTSVFNSQAEASEAVFGLQYPAALEPLAERVIYMGQSIIIKIPTNDVPLDLTNPEHFLIVGRVPQALSGFTSSAGQSGGGTGAYIPMKSYYYNSTYLSITCMNNAVTEIEGSTSAVVSVSLPSPTSGIMNQVIIHYTHTASKLGLVFNNVKWWYERQPVFENGNTYEIIGEYVNGYWRMGYIQGES